MPREVRIVRLFRLDLRASWEFARWHGLRRKLDALRAQERAAWDAHVVTEAQLYEELGDAAGKARYLREAAEHRLALDGKG